MAESKEELKNLLMKVKEESEKVGLQMEMERQMFGKQSFTGLSRDHSTQSRIWSN